MSQPLLDLPEPFKWTVDSVCAVCGKEGLLGRRYRNEYWPDLEFFNQLTVVACSGCGFGYVPHPPTDTELETFYATRYRGPSSPYFVWRRGPGREPFRSRALSQLGSVSRHTDLRRPGHIVLDVGAGLGEVLRLQTILNPTSRCFAVEQDLHARTDLERRLAVAGTTSISDFLTVHPEGADVVVLSHVLEHISHMDLASFLLLVRDALRGSGGIALIEVPNDDSILGLPSEDSPHLLFFSEKALRELLSRSGLEILCVERLGQRTPVAPSSPRLARLKNLKRFSLIASLADLRGQASQRGRADWFGVTELTASPVGSVLRVIVRQA